MKYVAVLKFNNPNINDIVSIEFDTVEQAENAGKEGMELYLSDGYIVEEVAK